jgi:hypothetical protein
MQRATINAKDLVDTGSTKAIYITRCLAELLINQGAEIQERSAVVSSGIRGSLEQIVNNKIKFNLIVFNELTSAEESISLWARIIDVDHVDLINIR